MFVYLISKAAIKYHNSGGGDLDVSMDYLSQGDDNSVARNERDTPGVGVGVLRTDQGNAGDGMTAGALPKRVTVRVFVLGARCLLQ